MVLVSKFSEYYALRSGILFVCIWIFWFFSSLSVYLNSACRAIFRAPAPEEEEYLPEEETGNDYDYSEDLGDDLTGATSHPTS